MNVTKTFSLPLKVVQELDNYVSSNPSEKKGKIVTEGIYLILKKRTQKINLKETK